MLPSNELVCRWRNIRVIGMNQSVRLKPSFSSCRLCVKDSTYDTIGFKSYLFVYGRDDRFPACLISDFPCDDDGNPSRIDFAERKKNTAILWLWQSELHTGLLMPNSFSWPPHIPAPAMDCNCIYTRRHDHESAESGNSTTKDSTISQRVKRGHCRGSVNACHPAL